MPVGKVFDAREGQLLFSPVSNYYQGKALRADISLREKQGEALQMEIDSAPAAAEAAQREEQRKIEKHQIDVDKAYRDARKYWNDENKETVAQVGEAAAAFTLARRENVDPTVAADKLMSDISNIVGEEAALKWREQYDTNGDGTFSPEEEALIAANAEAIGKLNAEDRAKLQQADFIDEFGNAVQGSFNPVTGEYDSSGKRPIAPQAGQSDLDPRTNPQRGAAYQQNVNEYNASTDVQELISSTLPRVIDLPGAVGAKGAIATAFAGALSSLGQDAAAEAFSKYMAGASQEDVAELQTQLQTLRGRVTDILTGEKSDRLSETERAIASNAVGLIDQGLQSVSDLTKAYPRVIGAMNQLYAEAWATKYRLAKRDEWINYPYDLSNKDQRIELLTEFSEAGVDINTAKRTIVRLKSIQGVN